MKRKKLLANIWLVAFYFDLEGDKVDKKVLSDYIDACELVRETEDDIRRLRRKKETMILGNVEGSNPEFPYQKQHYRIEGMTYTYQDDTQMRMEEKLLKERKKRAEKVKLEVEAYINTVPLRMQRIIRYRFFEGLSWEQVAGKIGKRATGESVRKEYERFIEEK